MRCVVTFVFGPEQGLEQAVSINPSTQAAVDAREWFEDAWIRLECEPSRASGKVLLLDKILCVTEALGYPLLSRSEDHLLELATQTAQALKKPIITVDLEEQMVGF